MGIMQEKGEKVDFGVPEVRYEAYVALFAGSDITAIAMRSVFYHLARSPKVLIALLDGAFPISKYPLEMLIPYADAIKLPLRYFDIKIAMFGVPKIPKKPIIS